MDIGDRIKQRRCELGLSQRALADKMGYNDHTTIARIEQGKVDITLSRLIKFASVLRITVEELLGEESTHSINEKSIEISKDQLLDIILRLHTDEEFLKVVEKMSTLDKDKLNALQLLLKAFGE